MVMKMEEGLDTGPIAMAERVPIAPDMTAGDLHDELARRGAGLMVRALARARARHARRSRRSRQTASPMRPRSARTRPASTGRSRGSRCTTTSAACRRFPAPGSRCRTDGKPVRVKVLRTTKGEGSGAPGTVLDDKLTIACGDGAVRILATAARRPAGDDGARNSCAARRLPPGRGCHDRCRDAAGVPWTALTGRRSARPSITAEAGVWFGADAPTATSCSAHGLQIGRDRNRRSCRLAPAMADRGDCGCRAACRCGADDLRATSAEPVSVGRQVRPVEHA